MNRIYISLVFVVFGAASFLEGAEGKAPERFIHVSGEGEVKAEPDEVTVGFQVETYGKDLREVQKESASRTSTLLDVMKKQGVAAKDVQTSNVQIHPRYDFTSGKRKFREYYAVKSFTVKLRDIGNYGAVLNGLLEAGVESVSGAQYSSSKLKQLKAEARKLAVLDAKAKAEVLAGPLGAEVGKPITISEQSFNQPVQPFFGAAMDMAKASPMLEDTLAAGEISIKTLVNVQFELR